MQKSEQKINTICLMGPTASGKTQLAISLCNFFPVELISVDSALVYRDMNIGTAKPSEQELLTAPHHLIDILNPDQTYSAAQFCTDTKKIITTMSQHQHIPLLVGGTMLYFHALQNGLAPLPHANQTVRDQIAQEAEKIGWLKLHQRLAELDPETAQKIHPNDPQRLQRALEIIYISGKKVSELVEQESPELKTNNFINIALIPTDREQLHQQIASRFTKMLDAGFVAEVESLMKNYSLTAEMPAMRAVGYRQVWQYLKGELTYSEMVERGIIASRQLAKRQLTWLRRWPNLQTFDPQSPDLLNDVVHFITARLSSSHGG